MHPLSDFNKTVSEIVRDDYRTSDVFKKYGINYCCSGQTTLLEACTTREVDYNKIVGELKEATRNIHISNALQFSQWRLDFLIDYIVNVHHAYQKMSLSSLEADLISLADSHKKKHPELEKIVQQFLKLSVIILPHNRHEEEIIFPYIKQIENTHRRKETYGNLFVRTLRKPLSHIENEHEEISNILREIQTLTHNYTCPAHACAKHQVIYKKLREFHEDMMQHKHLENNILFPRAIELEKELLQL